MTMGQLRGAMIPHQARAFLVAEWTELSNRYLPLRTATSIWRFSRPSLPADPAQGWKLHISATVLNAPQMLRTVAPFLKRRNILYKAPVSLDELSKLNSGIFYGYSQVGKCLTIYPQTGEEADALAGRLHQLTSRMSGPAVPFEEKYREPSLVWYRYGAFKALQTLDGETKYALRSPNGELFPDERESHEPPDWAVNPFHSPNQKPSSQPVRGELFTTYKTFRALAQRGRGGVYQALDLSVTPPRLCILKEGRKDGEVSWDGRDGLWRVRHEAQVLKRLKQAGINVPTVYSSFIADGNQYLAMELVAGINLEKYLLERKRRLSLRKALAYSVQIAAMLDRIHRAGWVWRDCKPRNIIITGTGEFRALDLEGACPIDAPDPLPWGTPAYSAPEASATFQGQSRLPEDLYSLGSVIQLLLGGRPPQLCSVGLEKLRRNVPKQVLRIVTALLDPDPQRRPQARIVAQQLGRIVRAISTANAVD